MDIIPRDEIIEKFSRAGGAGGQNVNKLSTKAEVRWNVGKSKLFSQEEKEKIKRALANKINKEGELIVVSQEARTQSQNRELAIERLNNLVKSALITRKKRKPTKPTKASKERRLSSKKRLSEKKKWRSGRI
jgi:ribosome-associated protein